MFKAKRSSKYCRVTKQHQGQKAAPCPSCFEQGISVSDCRLTHKHCGVGVTWQTVKEKEHVILPPCSSEIKCIRLTSTKTTLPVNPDCMLAHNGCQMPQDFASGFLDQYSREKWEAWLKCFSLQTSTEYKVCTGRNSNKESDTGVMSYGGERKTYKVAWRQCYCCFRGGKPRYKSGSVSTQEKKQRLEMHQAVD